MQCFHWLSTYHSVTNIMMSQSTVSFCEIGFHFKWLQGSKQFCSADLMGRMT